MTVRELVVDLFAEHLDVVADGPVRLRTLVSLLAGFGVAEPTTRMTTAALRRSGLLTASRHGRETRYAATDELRAGVRRRWARLEERLGPWDGQWRVVIYAVPETDRAARERVRRALTRHGFGPLAPATWLSPHRAALQEVRTELAREPLSRLDLLTARVAEDGSDRALATRCWDLEGVAAAYTGLADRLARLLEGPPPTGPEALTTHLRTLADARRIGQSDPMLPSALRPEGWPGPAVRELWEAFGRWVVPGARAHVTAVLGGAPQRIDPSPAV
ncbi:PaaX family transcriptional regulator C-terminal domain-containing protein [Geodermatophilus sp. SYSU D00758]